MKELLGKFLANVHIILFLYGAYGLFVQYEAHKAELESVTAEIPEIQTTIQKTEQKVKEIKDFIKKADEYRVRVEEVAKTIENVQRQLPAEINDSSILNFLQGEMKVLNIKDPSISPGSESKTTYFISKDYAVKANGTFLQFLVFIERIGNASRIYNIQSLKFTTQASSKRGRFQVLNTQAVIQAYKYNPEFKVDRNFEQQK